jgi:hypothetical protein
MRLAFESREQDVTREWEEKLQVLTNDNQGTIKYVRGLEKIFNKMKSELQRSKIVNAELEKEVAAGKMVAENRELDGEATKEWGEERQRLQREMADMQAAVRTSMANFETQISMLKKSLSESEAERARVSMKLSAEHEAQMRQFTDAARAELDNLRRENNLLEERAQDAEHKVQMFLDQFENSVDNYRRMSRIEQQTLSRSGAGAMKSDADSLYSTTTADDEEEREVATAAADARAMAGKTGESSTAKKSRDRTSKALDILTTELESLRTNWETTRGNYKLSDRFEFEKSAPTSHHMAGRESLSTWARSLGDDTESIESQESAERLLMTPNKKPASATSTPTNSKP